MSETSAATDRDGRTGRFLAGNGGGGRKPGARNKLGEQFLEDLRTVWQEAGIDALRRCAREDATGFCRIIAGVLPKDIDVSISIGPDATEFIRTFREARAALGNTEEQRLRRLRNEPLVIEQVDHDG